jgi:hypothetical protein
MCSYIIERLRIHSKLRKIGDGVAHGAALVAFSDKPIAIERQGA